MNAKKMNPSALVTNPAAVSSGTASVTSGSSVFQVEPIKKAQMHYWWRSRVYYRIGALGFIIEGCLLSGGGGYFM